MHGVGIVSLGFLMDAIFDRYSRNRIPTEADFAGRSSMNSPTYADGPLATGISVQAHSVNGTNCRTLSRDIQLLTSYLLYQYKARVWNK